MAKQRYSVLAQAEVTVEVVVLADSPEDAVYVAQTKRPHLWKQIIGPDAGVIDTVTERRKNGRAFNVEYNNFRPRVTEVVEE